MRYNLSNHSLLYVSLLYVEGKGHLRLGATSANTYSSVITFVLIPIVIILIIAVTWLYLTIKKIRLRYENIGGAAEAGNLPDIIMQQSEELESLKNELVKLDKAKSQLGKGLVAAVQKIGLVRFDAFDDVGGKLSFAAALLNDRGDGIVISSINGRQESRVYAKPVKEGESVYNLSIEEKEAIGQALR